MKEKLWLPLVTRLTYRIDKELYNAIGFLPVPYTPHTLSMGLMIVWTLSGCSDDAFGIASFAD
ncbi:MAG: hypothetical protein IH892_07610 [Planctomycetes bacterium]|nr:hypothetical protein [Planctomycetota bacterium]